MLCNSEARQFLKFSQVYLFIVILLYLSVLLSVTFSVPTTNHSTVSMLTDNLTNSSLNDDLYVIKAVVYEIGILTDSDNTTENTTDRQEEVKISFYNSANANNGS
ncbi:uncharacterized protein LOC143187818 [Calliopsis andreniformis]|uniref:uncharacterized protein LOC143187818 n=1 Tax=Calliopsis andreniformis TaxID=337506 RepID=UPI003FCD21EA